MEILGYYTAGFMMCLIGKVQDYNNCILYRSPNAYPTEQICQASLIKQSERIWFMFDQESFEVVDVKCVEWLPTRKKL